MFKKFSFYFFRVIIAFIWLLSGALVAPNLDGFKSSLDAELRDLSTTGRVEKLKEKLRMLEFVGQEEFINEVRSRLTVLQDKSEEQVDELLRKFDKGPWLQELRRDTYDTYVADSLIEGYCLLNQAFSLALQGQDVFLQQNVQLQVKAMGKKMFDQATSLYKTTMYSWSFITFSSSDNERTRRQKLIMDAACNLQIAKKLVAAVDSTSDFLSEIEFRLRECLQFGREVVQDLLGICANNTAIIESLRDDSERVGFGRYGEEAFQFGFNGGDDELEILQHNRRNLDTEGVTRLNRLERHKRLANGEDLKEPLATRQEALKEADNLAYVLNDEGLIASVRSVRARLDRLDSYDGSYSCGHRGDRIASNDSGCNIQ